MLLPRIITAVFGIPLVFLFIYTGGLPYFFFILGIIMFSVYEYYTMMKVGHKPIEPFSLFILSAIIPIALYINGENTFYNLYNFLPLFISLVFIIPLLFEIFFNDKYLERPAYTSFGIMLISFGLAHLILLRDLREDGRILTFAIIITVWTMDTAAYFVGSKIGKRKLSPVSPKKTIEGFFAGILASFVCIWIFNPVLKMSYINAFIFALIISLAGQLSDLAESLIKRAVGVKDSSNILPGHGGILDRFDSYLFIAPIAYYFLIFIR